MYSHERVGDWLAAACIVVAFGGLCLGRALVYPVSTVSGTLLERVAARSEAWDVGHRVMLVGMISMVPAAIGLRRALNACPRRLTNVAVVLVVGGAMLGVGQYALDFAMLAASRIEPPTAGEEFVRLLRSDSFVEYVFYRLPDLAQLGLILFTIALWCQGRSWRLPAVLVTVAIAFSVLAPALLGPIGIRIALGVVFLGFSTVAWKIAMPPATD